jgi:hypothetical protein
LISNISEELYFCAESCSQEKWWHFFYSSNATLGWNIHWEFTIDQDDNVVANLSHILPGGMFYLPVRMYFFLLHHMWSSALWGVRTFSSSQGEMTVFPHSSP